MSRVVIPVSLTAVQFYSSCWAWRSDASESMTVTQSKQYYWEQWAQASPWGVGQQDQVQGQSWRYRVPGQPGPHKTRLEQPNKQFLQDRKSLRSTFSSDFIPLPGGRKSPQDRRIISTNTYNHTYAWDASNARYGNTKTRKTLHRHPQPPQVLSESTVPLFTHFLVA